MLNAELNSRARRLEQEQAERLAKARRKLERERLLDARARRAREAHEEDLRARRVAEQERLDAVRAPAHMQRYCPVANAQSCLRCDQLHSKLLLLFPQFGCVRSDGSTMAQAPNCRAPMHRAQWNAHVQERLQHEEDLEHNNGVWWRTELRPVTADPEAVKQKGIRRGLDKVNHHVTWAYRGGFAQGTFMHNTIARSAAWCLGRVYSRLSAQRVGRQVRYHTGVQSDALAQVLLPPSAGAALMAQEAPKNGPQFFELATPQGARTHVGVLDFTAVEGVTALPPHVARNLWGGSGHVPEGEARLTVIYRKLLKGALIIDHIVSGILEQYSWVGCMSCFQRVARGANAWKWSGECLSPSLSTLGNGTHELSPSLSTLGIGTHELRVFVSFLMGYS